MRIERPGVFFCFERAKWDAWKSHEGLTREEAMLGYIHTVETIQ